MHLLKVIITFATQEILNSSIIFENIINNDFYRMSMLEDCASYLDGTIYNLEAKVTSFDDNESII
jgi:hypothetical protein